MRKIAIGNDHSALGMKGAIKEHLAARGIEALDVGADSPESCDYPVAARNVAAKIAAGEAEGGIIICGTGVGVSIAANKIPGMRACCCSEPYSAMLSKRHNDANVLCFGARVVGAEMAKMLVDAWLDAEFEGGRHAARIAMLEKPAAL